LRACAARPGRLASALGRGAAGWDLLRTCSSGWSGQLHYFRQAFVSRQPRGAPRPLPSWPAPLPGTGGRLGRSFPCLLNNILRTAHSASRPCGARRHRLRAHAQQPAGAAPRRPQLAAAPAAAAHGRGRRAPCGRAPAGGAGRARSAGKGRPGGGQRGRRRPAPGERGVRCGCQCGRKRRRRPASHDGGRAAAAGPHVCRPGHRGRAHRAEHGCGPPRCQPTARRLGIGPLTPCSACAGQNSAEQAVQLLNAREPFLQRSGAARVRRLAAGDAAAHAMLAERAPARLLALLAADADAGTRSTLRASALCC